MSGQQMSSERRRGPVRIIVRVVALVLALVICGVLYDLFFPRKTKLREFDADEVARLETAMWRSYYEKQRVRLFNEATELQSAIYNVPVERLMEHGYLRAEAITIRDMKAEQGGVTEADWAKINELLRQSWRSLATAVKS